MVSSLVSSGYFIMCINGQNRNTQLGYIPRQTVNFPSLPLLSSGVIYQHPQCKPSPSSSFRLTSLAVVVVCVHNGRTVRVCVFSITTQCSNVEFTVRDFTQTQQTPSEKCSSVRRYSRMPSSKEEVLSAELFLFCGKHFLLVNGCEERFDDDYQLTTCLVCIVGR